MEQVCKDNREMQKIVIFLFVALFGNAFARFLDFERLGAIPHNRSLEVAIFNGNLLNQTFNSLQPHDVFFVPNKTYSVMGGIIAYGWRQVEIRVEGTLLFSDDRDSWPRDPTSGHVLECIYLGDIEDVIFTSGGKGTLDGNGMVWWGAIDFLRFQEDRPRIMHIVKSKNILFENLLFKNSPYWTFLAEDSNGLVIRYCDVDARWTDADTHTFIDLQAFNTDGFDVAGTNVHIHDCNIWNQDDCIAVKDCETGSSNMLFERISCSGLGLVIGSIGKTKVHNITFRDSVMPNTFKGIYMKTRWYDDAPDEDITISDILYQNITIDNPEQYAIWIGPAQQTGQPCNLMWPQVERSECRMSGYQSWSNIVLKDITINNPRGSPGLIFGNASNPMRNIVFDNVVVNNPGDKPFGTSYFCEGIEGGVAEGSTTPVPPCFTFVN